MLVLVVVTIVVLVLVVEVAVAVAEAVLVVVAKIGEVGVWGQRWWWMWRCQRWRWWWRCWRWRWWWWRQQTWRWRWQKRWRHWGGKRNITYVRIYKNVFQNQKLFSYLQEKEGKKTFLCFLSSENQTVFTSNILCPHRHKKSKRIFAKKTKTTLV